MNSLNDVAYIQLTKGKQAIIDARDFEWLNQWNWCYWTSRSCIGGYAARIDLSSGRRVKISMHRLIFEKHALTPLGSENDVDHRSRDKLDNRFQNLRLATRLQNCGNRSLSKNNNSGYKGIRAIGNKWGAQINENGKRVHIGCYATAEEAALAYNEAALRVYGEFASLNKVENAILFSKTKDLNACKEHVFRGVSFVKRSGKWAAYAKKDGKRVHLGCFETEDLAIQRVEQYKRSADEGFAASD